MRQAFTGVAARGLRSIAFFLFAALAGCRSGGTVSIPMPKKIVDLSPPITPDLPVRQLGHRACEFLGLKERLEFTPVTPSKDSYAFGLMYYDLPSNLGAHLDVPARISSNGERADQIPLASLYGRARVIDLRWKDRSSPLEISDLENYKIVPDEILLLFVGYVQPQDEDWPAYSPISAQAAQWLVKGKKIRALATDMPSIGSFSRYADLMDKSRPPEEVWAERLEFFQAGIPVIEGLSNLARIVGEKNVVFVGFPLAIVGNGGAPVRAAALIY
jgi:kynurenine formamidase